MAFKTSYLSIVIALLTLTGAAIAHSKNCEEGATNMAEIRACVADEQESQVDASYKQTHAYVNARDKQAAALLDAAQKSWKVFAENSCEYSVAARKTEKMANDARLMCMQKFNDSRVKILNAYRQEFGKVQ